MSTAVKSNIVLAEMNYAEDVREEQSEISIIVCPVCVVCVCVCAAPKADPV